MIEGADRLREPDLEVPAPPPEAALPPPGLRLRPDPSMSSLDDGYVLLGGSPYRLLRLGGPGVRQVAAWWRGDPVSGAPAARALARKLLSAGLANPDPPPGPGDVAVVIPVRNRPAELARCLAGCAGLQVIVVDDGSTDPGAASAVAAAAGARCIRLPVSRGPGAARNAGLAAVATPFVAFVDSDCVPLPGWLDPLLRHFTDPLVAAVGPRIVAAGPAAQARWLAGDEDGRSAVDAEEAAAAPSRWLAGDEDGRSAVDAEEAAAAPSRWLARYEHARSALDMGATPSIVRPGARVPYLPAAALVVRRAAAGQGFAAGLPVGEDVDFVWRLAEAGWHVRYDPAASVAHAHRVRFGAWFARRKDYGTSAALLELRHPGRVPAVSMSGWSALAWLAVTAGQPAAGASVMAATTALLARKLAPAIEDPWPVAVKLAGGGNLMAGRLLGSAVSRTWWPLALPVALAVRRTRLPLAAMVLAAPIMDWRERRPPMDPVRYVAARLLDDGAYSLGVWQGCLRQRTIRPLLPRLWWRSDRAEPGGPA